MRLADANDYVFDSLMTSEDKIAYNIFSVIRNDKSSFIVTDDKYYIYAQNSRRSPHWLFIKEAPDENTFEELVALIAGMLKLNPLLRINGRPDYIRPILDEVSERYGAEHIVENAMTVYSCAELHQIPENGNMITPLEEHRKILTEYVTEMQNDQEKYFMPDEDTEKFVNALLNSKTLYLWEHNGRIVSMAKIAHRGKEFGRINTVFTDGASRGKGYTRMLVGKITKMLMDEGLIPVIYADDDDVDVNDAYKYIGYKSYGAIIQFAFN